ncbi:unnamed protein product [marine sediment metagenome]|uniref:Uncharacterized protein n=1 Tax=marine sediment metagenome TaxID=412755 RepID=X0UM80_9ZZZZ
MASGAKALTLAAHGGIRSRWWHGLPALMGEQDILVCLDSALTDESKLRADDRCNVHVI